MDFIEFCEYVLGHPLYSYQKTYLTGMYDLLMKAKEENGEIRLNYISRGSSKHNSHIAALYLASEYEKCLKCLKEEDKP